MSRPMTRAALDAAHCHSPECDHADHPALYLHPRCHPHGGLQVSYERARGVLIIECQRCEELVCEVAVASKVYTQGSEA